MSSFTITRMLPYRHLSETDVINMFSLNDVTGAAGSLVTITDGNLDLDPVGYIERADAQSFQNHMGNASSLYPEVPYKVGVVGGTGERPIGILLRDVRAVDENGENLQYYPRKKEELQCVISGEAVPIATRGQFMVNHRALAGGIAPAINSYAIPYTNGTLTGVANPTDEEKAESVGRFLATGSRASQQDTDEYEGVYALLKLEL